MPAASVDCWSRPAISSASHVTGLQRSMKRTAGFRMFLLDLGLPGMDGFEVARQIREDASFARAKVVVVSGYAGEEEHRR